MSPIRATTAWLRAALVENFPLKLLSFALSIGFYLYINGAQNAQRVYLASVVVLPPRENTGRVLLTQPPASVRVTVHGTRTVLDELKGEDLGSVQLDLRSGHPAFVGFDTSSLKIPPGLYGEIDPPGIELEWDDVVTRALPVQTTLVNQPLLGYAVESTPTPEPKMITAQGPKSLVDTLQNARAEPFDVGGLAEGVFTRRVALSRPPPRVSFDDYAVNVTVEIGRAHAERLVLDRPVQVVGVAHATTVPLAVDVKLSGPPEVVNVLRAEQIVPVADVNATQQQGHPLHGSATAQIIAHVDGCTAQVIPGTVVVKW